MAIGPRFIIAMIAARLSVAIRAPLFHWVEWQTGQRASLEQRRMTNSTNFGEAV